MINEKMRELGAKRSVIRELFEYGKKRKLEIGEKNVFDFSLGNPSVPSPDVVNDTLTRLISMPNVIVTSHQAFLTKEALNAIAKTTVDNLNAYFNGEKLENEVVF